MLFIIIIIIISELPAFYYKKTTQQFMVFPVDKTLKICIKNKNDKHVECHTRFNTLGETRDAAIG